MITPVVGVGRAALGTFLQVPRPPGQRFMTGSECPKPRTIPRSDHLLESTPDKYFVSGQILRARLVLHLRIKELDPPFNASFEVDTIFLNMLFVCHLLMFFVVCFFVFNRTSFGVEFTNWFTFERQSRSASPDLYQSNLQVDPPFNAKFQDDTKFLNMLFTAQWLIVFVGCFQQDNVFSIDRQSGSASRPRIFTSRISSSP